MNENRLRIVENGYYYDKDGDVEQMKFSMSNMDWFDTWKPIPLTEEWLKKFGFEKKHNIWADNDEFPSFNIYDESGKTGVYLYFMMNTLCDIKIETVHQLQSLYFALTGEELNDR